MSTRTLLLILVATLGGITLLSGCDGISQNGYKNISADEAVAKLNAHPRAHFVDVRAGFEYQGGHIEGATLIPLPEVQSTAKSKLKTEEEIIVYCQSGERSAEASKILASMGYTNVYNMLGGTDQWRAKGYPLIR